MQLSVVVRVRPLLPHEQQHHVAVDFTPGMDQDPSTLTLLAPETDPIDYHFAKCYDESTTQRTLYQLEVSPAVNGVFAGLDTMVLACGAPGAGKTFTMEGNERSVGIIPRCIRRLFQVADALHYVCIVSVSYTKVFNDRVQDLLATETADGSVDLLGLTESRVGNLQEFTALYQRGRSVSAAKFEQKSCWSLSILTVRVLTKNKAGGEPHDGKLHFIDMAGYGVNRPTGNNGLSLKERGERDNSLAKVMAMANGKDTSGSCRPFRESNLTQLLRSSLDGCGHTIMLFNVSPSATTYKETVQTLSCARDAQDGLLSQVVADLTPSRSIHVLDLAADLLKNSSLTPALIVSGNDRTNFDRTNLKRPMPNSGHAVSTPKATKPSKGKKRLMVSPPAGSPVQRVLVATKDDINNDKVEMSMEEKLLRWKQVKQALHCKKRGKTLAAGGIKRKLAEVKTIGLTKATSVRSPVLHGSVPRKNPLMSVNNDHKKPTLASPPMPAASSHNSAVKGKPRLSKSKDCGKTTKTTPEVQAPDNVSAQNPIMIENDREMPVPMRHAPSKPTPVLKKPSPEPNHSFLWPTKTFGRDPSLGKENQHEVSVLHNQNLPAPVATVEMKPELLAKDLVRVAIAFEKKRRLATAFCIFKRANHVLPKKSAKLTERLASLEDECAAVADQLPPQEMLTASYMVKVLENDLMSVLNDGSTKELTELYAVGSKRAELVRDKRPYQKLQELQKVSGVSANVVTKLYEHHTHWENHQ
ncbi:hypothetical protein PRIC1_002484 [Phytophthora ramorum]